MALGKKTGGRQKGTQNKLTTNVKDNVITVFENIGGVESMAEWAKEHPTQFYNLYAKLLPLNIDARLEGELITKIERTVVRPKP